MWVEIIVGDKGLDVESGACSIDDCEKPVRSNSNDGCLVLIGWCFVAQTTICPLHFGLPLRATTMSKTPFSIRSLMITTSTGSNRI